MELKPGYKQTEVGVIPEDWDVAPITSLLQPGSGITYGVVQPGPVVADGVLFIRGGDIYDGSIAEDNLRTISAKVSRQYERTILRGGELLVSLVGYPGEAAIVPPHLAGGNIARQVAIARLDRSNDEVASYICWFLRSDMGKKLLLKEAIGSAQKVINLRDISRISLPVPEKEERRKVVSLLDDMDALLASHEQLLDKKRNIKQAAMQDLLTGKRRLPGFEGEWQVKRLGDEIRDLEAGVSVRSTTDKDQLSTGRYILKTSAVSQGQFSPTERKEIISCDISRAKTPIKQGDLIISRMNTPALVGECGYSQLDHPNLFLPDRLWRTAYRDPHAVSSRWLAYTLSTQHNRARIKELATGTSGSMKNISKRALLNLEIKWPSMEEQIAIAEMLSEMDSDIDSLNDQLQKAQGIKQGMMQQLLTGKIRLK
ncbi:restriction endonuclease subunit S [Cyanobium sp. FGCU-6]|nr:restriction endonuclease subunit S [Cyanobium sp. FGCU6]